MLYETLSQPSIFLVLLLIGFVSGFIFDILRLVNYFFNQNKISEQILLFLGICALFLIFTETNLFINFGDIRFFPAFAFLVGLFLERISFGKLFAKVVHKCYNYIIKFWQRVGKYLNERKKKKDS